VDAADADRLSIIVPTLNEAAGIEHTLQALQSLRRRGHEIIVVDGGSSDNTAALATPLADRVIASARGRAMQMHAAAGIANGSVLWFLHADTRPPDDADLIILPALRAQDRVWGRFDVALSGHGLLLLVAWLMNQRSRLTGIATGDQAMFVTRAAYWQAGGFMQIPLMEDIALSRALRQISRPLALQQRVHTSNRRWQRHGVVRTVLIMWLLRLGYFIGVKPARLAAFYAAHDT
jgi:rSAM/selenodomain-associated transferase 2